MIALDTNILARFYIEEPDEKRTHKTDAEKAIAIKVMTSGRQFWVPKTVLLELEWVCRGVYKREPEAFLDITDHLFSAQNVELEDFAVLRQAVEWHRKGLGFADALHLGSSSGASEFITFDKRRFANRAKRLHCKPPVSAP